MPTWQAGRMRRDGGRAMAGRGMAGRGEERRRQILAVFEHYERKSGCPPTVREVARAVGITSTANVAYHLKILDERGLLKSTPGTARGRQLADRPGVPVHGTIAAGIPLAIYEADQREVLNLGQHLREAGAGGAEYALLVKGDSMIEDHIFDGDYVLVRPDKEATNGAIVVAVHLAEGERGAATVKRFYHDKPQKVVRLEPANAALDARTISVAEWRREWAIQGTVTGIYRSCLPKPTTPRRQRVHQAAGER